MTFGVGALISWLLTAVLGVVLVALWVARGSRSRSRGDHAVHSRPPPYIPRFLVVAHAALAAAGLVTWVAALVLVYEAMGWAALGTLIVVALLGASMFVRWLGSRRARLVARAASGAPAESRLPTVIVLSHGTLGVITVLLVVLSYFHPGPLLTH